MFIFSLNLTARKDCVDNAGDFSVFLRIFTPEFSMASDTMYVIMSQRVDLFSFHLVAFLLW